MNNDKFKVINETKKFIMYTNDILINYPRKYYVLKDKIERTSYEILELIYLANMTNDRLLLQQTILSKISMLDFYLEISYNDKIISLKKLNQGTRLLELIKKLMYGWVNSNGS